MLVGVFDTPTPYATPFVKTRPLHTPVTNLVPDTTTILALGKVIEALNLCQLVSVVPRGGFDRDRCGVSLWCGLFRHTRSMTVQKRRGCLVAL